MQVSVEKINSVERKLTISVPADQVEAAYDLQIQKYAKESNLKGFRPGKAPIPYIKQRFGSEAYREALDGLIKKSLDKALADENLRPISLPKIEAKSFAENQPFEYTASFEVIPEVSEIHFQGDEVQKPHVEITDKDIEQVIKQLRTQFTQWQLVDRAAKDEDRVIIDYTAKIEGQEEEKKIEAYALELGKGVMIPGFESGLLDAAAGDERTLDLKFPDDYHNKELSGKSVQFLVKIKEVYEADMPQLDEEFVKKLGIQSGAMEDLQKQIRETLEQETERLTREKLKEQVFNKLLEQNPLEVPATLVESEAKNIHDELYPQHAEAKHHHHHDEELSAFKDVAKKRVSLGILISEYAKQNKIDPDEARVKQRIQEISKAYEKPEEVIAWLSSERQRANIEAQVLEDQVMEKLLDKATVSDKTMSYAELKGIQS